jgi:hypothetical protein
MTIEALRTTEPGNPKDMGGAGICVEYGCVAIGFSEKPRGYGQSHYETVIHPDSFKIMAQAMMQANPEEAIKAFGDALKSGIPKPRNRWWPGCDNAA